MKAGFGDANGKPYDPSFESFFDVAEFYTFVELGWTPSIERKIKDHVRLTWWHQDTASIKGKPAGWGLSFSAAMRVLDLYSPFIRAGYAEGGAAPSQAAVVAGLGIHRRNHDLFGVALGWGRPHDTTLRDQLTFETFYRLQLTQTTGITPDIQVIANPSRHLTEDVIVVFSLRMQLAF